MSTFPELEIKSEDPDQWMKLVVDITTDDPNPAAKFRSVPIDPKSGKPRWDLCRRVRPYREP